ncbi:hypothetical protein HK099_001825 [Clydaea vesicula]|uniref:Uncharacterized protein n=1 Tax=Clydaea vesicula TaxID=447962 RepID=A0AAD5U672_9FUNG|nr:hypothetical protein HK099_001825 [Clydaea vesicula]
MIPQIFQKSSLEGQNQTYLTKLHLKRERKKLIRQVKFFNHLLLKLNCKKQEYNLVTKKQFKHNKYDTLESREIPEEIKMFSFSKDFLTFFVPKELVELEFWSRIELEGEIGAIVRDLYELEEIIKRLRNIPHLV